MVVNTLETIFITVIKINGQKAFRTQNLGCFTVHFLVRIELFTLLGKRTQKALQQHAPHFKHVFFFQTSHMHSTKRQKKEYESILMT